MLILPCVVPNKNDDDYGYEVTGYFFNHKGVVRHGCLPPANHSMELTILGYFQSDGTVTLARPIFYILINEKRRLFYP